MQFRSIICAIKLWDSFGFAYAISKILLFFGIMKIRADFPFQKL